MKTLKEIKNHKITKTTYKILKIKLTILVLAILPLVVFTLITSKAPIIANIQSFVVQTGSMQPAIPVGSIIYVQKTNQYDKGDIISFTNKANQTVTHRIVTVKKDKNIISYVTRGDANNVADMDPVTKDKILGKMVFQVPVVGSFVNYLKTPQGFISAIVFPTLIFIGIELWNIKKEIEKETEKKVLKRMQANSMSS